MTPEKEVTVRHLMLLTRLGYYNHVCSTEIDRELVLSVLEGILRAD